METLLTNTGSKYTAPGQPLYPGDLINNNGCYYPRPDFKDDYWKMLAMNAEGYNADASRAKWGYDDKKMLYCAVSSGWKAYEQILKNSDIKKVLEHSERFTTPDDEHFLTIQKSSEVLDGGIVKNDIFALNNAANLAAIEYASIKMPKAHIVGPADREGHLRALGENPSMLRGAKYEDAIYEINLWGPFCLMDAKGGIYHGDHAWSRYAANEKSVALAVQYGSQIPLMIRGGVQYDVTDIKGDPVSLVDQAWEDARQIIDVTRRKVIYDGQEYKFRTETSVALMLSRFMHDDMWRTKDQRLDQKNAHTTVKKHYRSKEDKAQMQLLWEHMAPWIANNCDWPTLHNILNEDKDLKEFYETHVLPMKNKMKPQAETENFIFSYLPRGGFDHPELRKTVEVRKDPPIVPIAFSKINQKPRSMGVHEKPFCKEYDPKIFNDRNFARLGHSSYPDDEPDKDHYSFNQNACTMIINAFRDGRPPQASPNRLMYLDDTDGGVRATAVRHKRRVHNPAELKMTYNELSGKESMHDHADDASFDYQTRIRQLAKSKAFAKWREQGGISESILSLSDVSAAAGKYKNRREGLDAEYHEGIAAHGSSELGGDAIETIVRRMIDLDLNGLIIPSYEASGKQYRYIFEGVLAALGQTPRPHSGGKYRFEFFMDHDYYKPPADRGEPQKLDFLDLFIHMGMKVKSALDQNNPPKLRDEYVTVLRMCDLYEHMIDPGRRNVIIERDAVSGADHEHKKIDFNQADPSFVMAANYSPGLPEFYGEDYIDQDMAHEYSSFFNNPEYVAFAENRLNYTNYMADPGNKARLAHMMWAWMCAEKIPLPGNVYAPVSGHLRVKGIRAFDKFDLRDLKPEDDAAFDWWHSLNAQQRQNVFKQNTLDVEGPQITRK